MIGFMSKLQNQSLFTANKPAPIRGYMFKKRTPGVALNFSVILN
jgi:hypothetical protein